MYKEKTFIGVLAGLISYLLNSFDELAAILILLCIIDYLFGITASIMSGKKFDVRFALFGLFKKLAYICVIILSYLADRIVHTGVHSVSIELPEALSFGIIATLYLIGTEGLSIGQNLATCGVPAPKILHKFFGIIKK